MDQWSKTTSHQKKQEDQSQHSELRTLRCPWSIDKFLNFIFTYFSYIFIAGKRDSHGESSTSEEAQRNLSHGPAETENPFSNDDNVDVQGNLSHDLPEWLQEFKENLADERVPVQRDASSSSQELRSEPRAKVVPSEHNIFAHFPKDRNRDICLRTKITSASCRKRTGTVVPRADFFGELITADHKVLSEGCGS